MAFPAAVLFAVATAAFAGVDGPCTPRAMDTQGVYETDVLYLPTPPRVVQEMLGFAGVSPDDVVYDLGSGDGRIPIAAARDYGARGVGIELDGGLVTFARCRAREARVEQRVEFREQDLFDANLRDATVVTLFLFPEINRRLAPKLRAELRPGTRIVSHQFDLGDWPPDAEREVDGRRILRWTVPSAR